MTRRHDHDPEDLLGVADRRVLRAAGVGILLAALLLTLFVAAQASAQTVTSLCGLTSVRTPAASQLASGAAYQQLIVGASAVSPTIPVMASNAGGPIIGATVQLLTGLVNYRTDGTNPTSLLGDTIGPNTTTVGASQPYYEVCGADLNRISLIRSSYSATDSTTNWRFYVP